MKRIVILLFCLLWATASLFPQQDSIRNVILMIPDGTSTSVLSMARWYKAAMTNRPDATLALDPYLCGLVKTFSSDAPIGDSAPTTSCYMTGMPSQASCNSMYPLQTDHDLVPVDATKAYQPLMTAFEAARLLHNKSIGMVATSYTTDATPADCMAHYYNRNNREILTKQFVHNGVEVLLGGGNKEAKAYEQELKAEGYHVVFDDLQDFRSNESSKLWAIFGANEMPYNLDRDTARVPSLAEMTEMAIRCLSKNPNGFALMVEGSKVDWAAHDNDAKTIIDEFLEFDKAVELALNFAKKDGHTVVIIVPDHGNSAMSMGNERSNKNYKHLTLDDLVGPLLHYSITAEKMGDLLSEADENEMMPLFKKHFDFELSDEDLKMILDVKANAEGNAHYKTVDNLTKVVTKILYANTYIGFTTHGHTGEDVFLAVYHPYNQIPTGLQTNMQVNDYLCKQLGIVGQLPVLTEEYYAKHQEVFAGYDCQIEKMDPDNKKGSNARLTVKNKKRKMEMESFTNYVWVNGEKIMLPTPIIYVDKNETFYLPKNLSDYIK